MHISQIPPVLAVIISHVRAHTHTQDIYLENPNVTWDDIIGLEAPKRLVKEAVVYPIKVGSLECTYLKYAHS